jgi:phage tail-like protein
MSTPDTYYPPPGFAFLVQIVGQPPGTSEAIFEEVSGIPVEVETQCETGANVYQHRLPKGAKSSTLRLKRGLLTTDQPLILWCRDILQGNGAAPIQTATLIVQLRNVSHRIGDAATASTDDEILREWSFSGAWPTQWKLSALNATNREVVVESIEFNYADFKPGPMSDS